MIIYVYVYINTYIYIYIYISWSKVGFYRQIGWWSSNHWCLGFCRQPPCRAETPRDAQRMPWHQEIGLGQWQWRLLGQYPLVNNQFEMENHSIYCTLFNQYYTIAQCQSISRVMMNKRVYSRCFFCIGKHCELIPIFDPLQPPLYSSKEEKHAIEIKIFVQSAKLVGALVAINFIFPLILGIC